MTDNHLHISHPEQGEHDLEHQAPNVEAGMMEGINITTGDKPEEVVHHKTKIDHDDCDKTHTDLESDLHSIGEGETASAAGRDVPASRRLIAVTIIALSLLMVASAVVGAAVGAGVFSRDETSGASTGEDDLLSTIYVDNQNVSATNDATAIDDNQATDERFDTEGGIGESESTTGKPLPESTGTHNQSGTAAATGLPTQTSWPELVGLTGLGAKKMIESKYPDVFDIVIVVDGTPLTRDYRRTRIRIIVDEEGGIVVRTPHVG